jgi:hypothetical protein
MTQHINLISAPRNGSTYFGSVLRAYHSPESTNIQMKNSVVNRQATNEPFRNEDSNTVDNYSFFLDNLIVIENLNKSVIKNHISQLVELEYYNLLERYKRLDLYNIVLIRKNLFESSLSAAIARTKNEWFNHRNFNSISISTDVFKNSIDHQIKSIMDIANNNLNFKYHEIVYFEDLKFWPRMDYFNTRLCKESDIDNLQKIAAPSRLFKSPNKIKIVENYEELYKYASNYIPNVTQDCFMLENTTVTEINFK